jgi:hypothetical protein
VKRQTTFRFLQKPLILPEYILFYIDVAGLDDRAIARMIEKPHVPGAVWGNLIPAIKHVRKVTGLGLKESKDYVEACRDAYPEEWQ